MRALRGLFLSGVVVAIASCGGGKNNDKGDASTDGKHAQCNDGIDNDGDGKIDYPYDPGCFAPNQDDETDDCPDGPNCPQCSNGKDDDENGATDYPDDPGCTAASDTDEYTENPVACGATVHVMQLPPDGHATGTLPSTASNLMGTCGGAGAEDIYELRILHPKVVIASTSMGSTAADTVLYLRSAQCMDQSMELACNDDVSGTDHTSSFTYSITRPGTYYLVVDAKTASLGGAYDLHVQLLTGEGEACSSDPECGPGLVCRIPLNGSSKVCAKHVCSDGVDDDGDGKNDFPDDPGCTLPTDDDETDDCPSGSGCPQCGNGSDDDHDNLTDYPADFACASASGTSEVFCAGEMDATSVITTKVNTGTTVGKSNDHQPMLCSLSASSMAPDIAYALLLPVPVATISIDTNGSSFDTMLYIRDAQCTADIACDDDGGTFPQSLITRTNMAPGAYAIVVDGYSTDSGTTKLTVQGTVAPGTDCSSALFTGGANAVLLCPNGTTCTGTPKTCQ